MHCKRGKFCCFDGFQRFIDKVDHDSSLLIIPDRETTIYKRVLVTIGTNLLLTLVIGSQQLDVMINFLIKFFLIPHKTTSLVLQEAVVLWALKQGTIVVNYLWITKRIWPVSAFAIDCDLQIGYEICTEQPTEHECSIGIHKTVGMQRCREIKFLGLHKRSNTIVPAQWNQVYRRKNEPHHQRVHEGQS